MAKSAAEPQEDLEDDFLVEPLSLTPKRKERAAAKTKKKFQLDSDDEDDDLLDLSFSSPKPAKPSQKVRLSFSDSDDDLVSVPAARGHLKQTSRSRRRSVIRNAGAIASSGSDSD